MPKKKLKVRIVRAYSEREVEDKRATPEEIGRGASPLRFRRPVGPIITRATYLLLSGEVAKGDILTLDQIDWPVGVTAVSLEQAGFNSNALEITNVDACEGEFITIP